MDAWRFLHSRDPLAVQVVQAVALRVLELRDLIDRNRAVLTANAVGQMLTGGRK